ncbi:MAG: glycoside hydrolase family 57 protein [Mariprofundaceae bacterium]
MRPLSVVFYWHMHQPFYREEISRRYALPWVYLHAIKDYTDMASILDQVPGARAVVNFVPSLTIQIEDYASRCRAWLDGEGELPDPLLSALASSEGNFSQREKAMITESCFRLNHERNLRRYPEYQRLLHLLDFARKNGSVAYLGSSYYLDLLTWYHLAWLGETVRDHDFVARRLMEKGSGFNHQDRRDLINLITHLLTEIPERYRKLAEEGKIELSTTPYAHPILPLLLDFDCARDAISDIDLPSRPYPGGEARARDHVKRSQQVHQATFGGTAAGCWPAEGGVSESALAMMADEGYQWTATGEGVLRHTLEKKNRDHADGLEAYHPWRIGEGNSAIACFCRDDKLSDLLGFEYSRWNTSDAIHNFLHELAAIRHRTQGEEAPIVSIIMDGENAWEHYHDNALPFLTGLYQAIADHDEYELTTFSEYLRAHPAEKPLTDLVAGSWVYGNFATWIGDPAKNLAWELLIDAKEAFDRKKADGQLRPEFIEAAEEQLRICEGSDWCWWFGDYNPAEAVRDFDRLYRQHLCKLYELIGAPIPEGLQSAISEGGGVAEGGGTMRRGS